MLFSYTDVILFPARVNENPMQVMLGSGKSTVSSVFIIRSSVPEIGLYPYFWNRFSLSTQFDVNDKV